MSPEDRKVKRKSLYKLCKNDIILGVVLAGAALVLFACFFFFKGSRRGELVVITIDGQEYGSYELSEEQRISIDTEKGHNLIVIAEGNVYMEEADCPDGYCISQGKISKVGETLVCLPHRLVVEIRSRNNETGEFDVIAQ